MDVVPFHIQCDTNPAHWVLKACACPQDRPAGAGHLPGCAALDPDGQLVCPPGSACCQLAHSHAGRGCRTITITMLPGSAQLAADTAGAPAPAPSGLVPVPGAPLFTPVKPVGA